MLHLKNGLTAKDLKGFTAIVPSFSIVNASQLALDVLIASKQMKRIGDITDLCLVPIFGHSAFKHNTEERSAACEVYADMSNRLLAIQFRTVMVFEHAGPFHKLLAEILKDMDRVIILSTAVQYGQELELQYEASEKFKQAFKTDLDNVGWREHNTKSEIVGGGNDKLLLKVFDLHDIPSMILYRFVGFPTDALQEKAVFHQLTDLIVKFLKISGKFELTLPIGWKSLVGNESGEMMY